MTHATASIQILPTTSLVGRGLMHSEVSTARYLIVHITGAVFPATAGLLLFGWRAMGTVAVVMGFAWMAFLAWRRIGSRGAQLDSTQVSWLAGLLALTLPAHLFRADQPGADWAVWPVLGVAGILLVMVMWFLAAAGAGRVHPVVVTHLLLTIAFGQLLIPQHALQWGSVFWGDVLNAAEVKGTIIRPWSQVEPIETHDAINTVPASVRLREFTSGRRLADRAQVSLDSLLRGWMPPLEDLLTGGQPAPIGLGSAICVIVGGLYLLYRGAIDARVPIAMLLTAVIAMLLLPIPVVTADRGLEWWWLAGRSPDVGWPLHVTLVNYELLAGPLLFTAFFLASAPMVRPVARRARVIYAIFLGLLAAVFQLYVSVMIGAYLAVLVGGLFGPSIDRMFKPRTLV